MFPLIYFGIGVLASIALWMYESRYGEPSCRSGMLHTNPCFLVLFWPLGILIGIVLLFIYLDERAMRKRGFLK